VIEFLDPKAEPAAVPHDYVLGLGPDPEARPLCIGLLANGFADSEEFLAAVGTALGVRMPRTTFVAARKPNPSVLVSDEVFDDLVARCDAVVTAYGH
jgi:hypothetical protein